jgi:ribosomal protein S18 acetylase RimI-like enzyme
MATPVVRDAKEQDAPVMEELLVEAWQTAYAGVVDPAFVATRRTNDYAGKFRAMMQSGEYRLRVAEAEGRVVGLATGELLESGDYDCETKGLYVHPQHQGRGVGSALLRDMMEHFRRKGRRSMIVWTFLGVRNNGFYRAMGGTIREEEEREYGGKKYRMAGFAFCLSEKGAAHNEDPA